MKSEGVLDWEMHKDKHCINCNEVHHFDFCPNCGQPYEKKKISFKVLYEDFKERVLGLDGKFIRTIIQAFKDPGYLSNTYIAGNRRQFVGPVGFFFICLTIYVLIMSYTGNSPADLLSNEERLHDYQMDSDPTQLEIYKLVGNLMNEYFKIISFFSVLLFGFFIWLFNLKRGLNFLENLVFAFYYYAIVYLLSPIQFLFMQKEFILYASLIALIIQIGYFIWAYVKFDVSKSTLKRVLKAIGIQLVVNTVIAILAMGAIVVYLANNKELLEQIKNASGK